MLPMRSRTCAASFSTLAVRGKLVEQDPNDEPVSELLKRIAAGKARLVKAGEIKKAVVNPIDLNDAPFHLPLDWIWSTVGELMHVEMGQSPPSEHYNQSGEGLPFYQGKTDFGPRQPFAQILVYPTQKARASWRHFDLCTCPGRSYESNRNKVLYWTWVGCPETIRWRGNRLCPHVIKGIRIEHCSHGIRIDICCYQQETIGPFSIPPSPSSRAAANCG